MSRKIRRKKKVIGTAERPRLVVYRSNKYLHAQLVDDTQPKVLMGMFDKSKVAVEAVKEGKTKVERSKILGKVFAEQAKKLNISKIVFDRNGYHYHGRVKAFADGAREGGLDF
ncbi:50S ribosomal protein L18 [Caldithrix abyssi]|uniref:Large ribosomal subunit protein uL18 n=1 Tax=Caldithrix abyssi DSM 13497 TaxID=880073 RepID=H1XVY0_CALAY|nr:50S ribosomal protein L18 [Caldithrix abyssi]APF17669.1 rplR LSU ribosomal protein L18P [Caldithrix abyssi DSM 13497]EHO41752.1 ribosomal protein L18 [Caldithrix abyssi DSM 13497]